MNKQPTLYKKTVSGATQIWYQVIEGNSYYTVSGQLDGALVQSTPTITTPKNVGKANETTAEQQAVLEVEANYKKKLAQGGYHENIEDIDYKKYFEPMLAYDVDKKPIKNWNQVIWSQPKFDGIRCIAKKDGLWSRKGKPIVSVPHIMEQLKPLFERFPDAILDGEIYADKFADNFNEIISLARKTKPTKDDLVASQQLDYFVYDHASDSLSDYDGRMKMLKIKLGEIDCLLPNIRIIGADRRVHSEEEMNEFICEYLEQGYEGQILRINNGKYENKRTRNLLKHKSFKTAEFVVVDFEEGLGNRSGMAGKCVLQLPDGRPFKAGIRGNRDAYRKYLTEKEKYIGGEATVRFPIYTPDGKPRFGVVIAFYPEGRDM
jgi:DNA ligase 1